jgi:WD40 repeat protein
VVPKITDFGLAKLLDDSTDGAATRSGVVFGTPAYMAPEQAAGRTARVGPAADVYSLGVLLYEMLTGRPPLRGESDFDTLRQVLEEEPLRPARLRPKVPRDLETVCLKCLEKEPARRYASAQDLADDLRRYLAGEPVRARRAPAWERALRWARRRPAQAALAAAGAVAALTLAAAAVSIYDNARLSSVNAELVAARDKAEKATDEADRQRAYARRLLYASDIGLAQRAWDEDDAGKARELLDHCLPREGEADLRGFEWHFLNRQAHPERRVLGPHSAGVFAVAYSPDGTRLACASGAARAAPHGEGEVRVIDTATGAELLLLKGHAAPVERLAYSTDGKLLATGSPWDQTVIVWDAESGRQVNALATAAHSLSFAPDGRLAVAQSRSAQVFDPRTGQVLLTLATPAGSAAFSPDGRTLATSAASLAAPGVPAEVKLWDAATGREERTFVGHGAGILWLTFAPDGGRLAGINPAGAAQVWDVRTGRTRTQFRAFGVPGYAAGVAFSPDGRRLATAGTDRLVKLWDAESGRQTAELRGHLNQLYCVAFSPDGQSVVSGGMDRTARVWDAAAPPSPRRIAAQNWGSSRVSFSPDGRRITALTMTATVSEWGAEDGRVTLAARSVTNEGRQLAYSPDGKYLAIPTGSRNGVLVLDAHTGAQTHMLPGIAQNGERRMVAVAFSRDGSLLAAAGSGYDLTGPDGRTLPGPYKWTAQVKVWKWPAAEELTTLVVGADARVTCLAFTPDGERLVVSTYPSDGTGKIGAGVWDVSRGREVLSLPGVVNDFTLSPDGRWLASFAPSALPTDSAVELRDMTTGALKYRKRFPGSSGTVAFSPDGARLAAASLTNPVTLWDVETGREVLVLQAECSGVAFSPDGTRLAASDKGGLLIWDAGPPDRAGDLAK